MMSHFFIPMLILVNLLFIQVSKSTEDLFFSNDWTNLGDVAKQSEERRQYLENLLAEELRHYEEAEERGEFMDSEKKNVTDHDDNFRQTNKVSESAEKDKTAADKVRRNFLNHRSYNEKVEKEGECMYLQKRILKIKEEAKKRGVFMDSENKQVEQVLGKNNEESDRWSNKATDGENSETSNEISRSTSAQSGSDKDDLHENNNQNFLTSRGSKVLQPPVNSNNIYDGCNDGLFGRELKKEIPNREEDKQGLFYNVTGCCTRKE